MCYKEAIVEVFFIAKETTEATLQYARLGGTISELECRQGVIDDYEKMCSQEVRLQAV